MGLKKHGITSETIKNMILGAGVIYKNLKYEKPSNGWTGTPLGATSGGLKFNYEAQWLDVEVDGATVLIKGVSKQKVGESATLEGQMTELTEDILVSALHLVKSTSEDTTYAVQVAIMFIGEIISAAFQIITMPWMFIWENCKEYIIAAWEFIKNAVSTALDAISTTISNIWNAIVGFLTPILDGIKNTFTTIWEAIKTAVSTAINNIQTVITTVWNAIVSFLKPILEGIKNTFTTVWNAIKSTISTVLNAIQTTITNIWNAIKTTVTNVINSIRSKVLISTVH